MYTHYTEDIGSADMSRISYDFEEDIQYWYSFLSSKRISSEI